MFQSIHQVPKKTAKAKPELIDVDLVRGRFHITVFPLIVAFNVMEIQEFLKSCSPKALAVVYDFLNEYSYDEMKPLWQLKCTCMIKGYSDIRTFWCLCCYVTHW